MSVERLGQLVDAFDHFITQHKAPCRGFVLFRWFRPSRWHRWRESQISVVFETCERCGRLR